MQNALRNSNNVTLVIPGLVAYRKAQQGRDTLTYSKSKEETLLWLDEVFDMKRDVEGFHETLDPKVQADNHYWYVQGLIIIFPVYYCIGEIEKAKRAYERAKAWSADEAMLGITSSSYSSIEAQWSELIMPWHKKVWRSLVSLCARIGEFEMQKWRGAR